ncbi:MAG: Maf family protein [Pseudomonadota bacterium]
MLKTGENELVLASASVSRATLLKNAGLSFRIQSSNIDESVIKASCKQKGETAMHAAMRLAEAKGKAVSANDGELVLAGDQILSCDGAWYDKPKDLQTAADNLSALQDRTHYLETAACLIQKGRIVERFESRPALTMRPLSNAFIDNYLKTIGDKALSSVGGYQLEGSGLQLFSSVKGDYFSILGLPMLDILHALRARGLLSI